jgi:hypothetical protein
MIATLLGGICAYVQQNVLTLQDKKMPKQKTALGMLCRCTDVTVVMSDSRRLSDPAMSQSPWLKTLFDREIPG